MVAREFVDLADDFEFRSYPASRLTLRSWRYLQPFTYRIDFDRRLYQLCNFSLNFPLRFI